MPVIKVLLIDDDKDYYVLARRMLVFGSRNFTLDWESTYRDGLETMLKRKHDAYLVDYQLGTMSGIDLVREALSHGIDAPIIMVTGQGERETGLNALRLGATDYIEKIINRPADLQRVIDHAIHRADAARSQKVREALYRTIVEETLDGIIITDLQGEIVFANAAAASISASTPHALIGRPIGSLLASKDNTPLLTPSENGLEMTLTQMTGEKRETEVFVRMVHNRQHHFIIRDVTQHRRSIERRDRHIEQLTILHQIDDELSLISNTQAVLALAMDACVRLSGANAGYIGLVDQDTKRLRVAQSQGRGVKVKAGDFIPDYDVLQHLLESGEARLVNRYNRDSGLPYLTTSSYEQLLVPLSSHEKVHGFLHLETNKEETFNYDILNFLKLVATRIGIAVENAELYRVSQTQLEELQELYSKVSSLEQIKSDMIRVAAHDLRNPINALKTLITLLRRIDDPDRRKLYIDQLEVTTNKMASITSDILSLERIEEMHDNPGQLMDMHKFTEDCIPMLMEQARLKSQEFKYQPLSKGKSPIVLADPVQVREAVENLIINAIKYTPEQGSIKVSVQVKNAQVIFKVEDNGYGIPEELQANLFKPFYRAKSEETAQIDGTGLGLYLVKNIVERFSGEIIFSSIYGKGSVFGFALPLADRNE